MLRKASRPDIDWYPGRSRQPASPGNPPAFSPPFGVDNKVDQVSDLGLNRAIRNVHVRLERQGGQPRERLARRIRVDRRERTGMAGIDGLNQIPGFAATHLADNDPVRPMTQRCF